MSAFPSPRAPRTLHARLAGAALARPCCRGHSQVAGPTCRYRLPLGISVNMAAFSATLMAEVSYQPKILLPYLHLGLENEMVIQDVRALALGYSV